VNSGSHAVKAVQKVLGLEQDGIMGKMTISAINAEIEAPLLARLKAVRTNFYRSIVANDPTQSKFLNGWLNRVEGLG